MDNALDQSDKKDAIASRDHFLAQIGLRMKKNLRPKKTSSFGKYDHFNLNMHCLKNVFKPQIIKLIYIKVENCFPINKIVLF